MRNKRGPKIEPCGTPHVTDLDVESCPLSKLSENCDLVLVVASPKIIK